MQVFPFHWSWSSWPLVRAILLFLAIAPAVNGDDRQMEPAGARQAQVGPGIAVFVPAGYQPGNSPSLALVAPPTEIGPLPADWQLTPEFSLADGHASAMLAVPAGSSLYGTGEVTGPLLRNGRAVALSNTDNFAYQKHGGQQLYQSHPWALGVRPNGTAFGVLFDTSWIAQLRTDADRITFDSEGGPFRVFVVDRESPQAVMRGLAELIGTMPLPPKWALGFQQCRYSYFPDARVRQIADEFRARRLPCDAIWLDIDYMAGYRIFTFDPSRFPDPKATNDYLHGKGFHSVWMIDPGVKAEPGYPVYDGGNERHLWVRTKDGEDFRGKVWPGDCVFPDFTMPETRQWWGGLYKHFLAQGVDGVWNDMNEPAVFGGPDGSMPADNAQRGGGGLPPGPHRMYHNVFGMLMARSTQEGMLKARPDQRPFVLTRSNFLGGQRYAATWTGDNKAEDGYLRQSIPMSINLGLSGQPLSGPDIGGYEGKGTPELYANWLAVGVFYPFSRAHASNSSPDREPWVFGPEIENIARAALERRYRLLPYLYTLARQASVTGEPIMQPVFFADPKDADLRAEDRAFLFGPDLLVVPRWADAPNLPKGIWQDVTLLDGHREQDGYQPALKVRGGAIVPLAAVSQDTNESSPDPSTLLICLNEKGEAQGTVYEDAGDGFAYRDGAYALIHYAAAQAGGVTVIRQDRVEGKMRLPVRDINVEVMTRSGVVRVRGNLETGIRVPTTR